MKRLQTKLFITFISITLIMVSTMCFCFYGQISPKIRDILKNDRMEVVEQTGENIDNVTNMLLFAISIGPFQTRFKALLTTDITDDPYETRQFEKEVAEMFTGYSETYQNMKISYYVTMIGFNGFKYSSADAFDFELFKEEDWIQDVMDANGKVVWIPTQEDPYARFSSKNIYIISRSIRTGSKLKSAGTLSIMIDEDSLYRIYGSKDSTGAENFIIDTSGQIVSHHDKELIGTSWESPLTLESLNGKTAQTVIKNKSGTSQELVSYRRLESSNWWLVETIPMDFIMDSSVKFSFIMGLSASICVLLSIVVSFLISKHLCRPIVALNEGMKKISNGVFSHRIPMQVKDEIGSLTVGYNKMAENIEQLIREIQEQEKAKNLADIRFLQAQINPHFIYNTLNSVRCMIMIGNADEAANTLIFVIHMMRTVLNGEKMFVTLDSEMNTLNDYMEIQKAIYYKELELQMDISPNVHMSLIPKLILQPLVENSVFHGIVPHEINGIILIKAYKTSEDTREILHIIVTDNGIMEPEVLISLREKLKNNTEEFISSSNHIGLTNVSLRIQQIYGPQYGLELLDTEGIGTSIHLWLPNIIQEADIPERKYDL